MRYAGPMSTRWLDQDEQAAWVRLAAVVEQLRLEDAGQQLHDGGQPDPGRALVVVQPSCAHGPMLAQRLTHQVSIDSVFVEATTNHGAHTRSSP